MNSLLIFRRWNTMCYLCFWWGFQIFIKNSFSCNMISICSMITISSMWGLNQWNIGATEERYAIAGAKLMLEYAFNERRLNNCHTGFIENDTIYKPIFEKLGFKLEGVRRQQVFHKGKYWDECLYGMLAEEFNSQK